MDIRKELDKIMKEIKKNKEYWRFNYSIGESNGNCWGSSYENETKLKKTRK